MIHWLYTKMVRPFFEVWRTPSKDALRQRELAEAERKLLLALSGLDYAKAMTRYETARVKRLRMPDAGVPAQRPAPTPEPILLPPAGRAGAVH